jgi:hypothetical protein
VNTALGDGLVSFSVDIAFGFAAGTKKPANHYRYRSDYLCKNVL